MRFEAVPIAEAEGAILGHNLADADGRRALRKGKALTAADLEILRALGRKTVHVARFEAGDVDENTAAERIAAAAVGDAVGAAVGTAVGDSAVLRRSAARTGRVNLYAEVPGVLRIDVDRLHRLGLAEGVTLATLRRHRAVAAGKMVATLKIIPYAVPEAVVAAAEATAGGPPPLLQLTPFAARRAGLVVSGSPGNRERITRGFREALTSRLAAWNATLDRVDFVPLDGDGAGAGEGEGDSAEATLAAAIRRQLDDGVELLILAGETAIMDRPDIAPRAIERAGGEVVGYGAPVDPGNLLLIGYRGAVPIVGAPGCARSPKTNVVDLVVPRLLAGDRLDAGDLAALAHGGLLEDVPERRLPRSWVD